MTGDAAGKEELQASLSRARARFRTVGDMVTWVIRERILDASFSPGEHLRQDDLARQLEVSRMPVRSALLQLESEGLVEFHPHRGAIVAELDAGRIQEAYEIRGLLEGLAVAKGLEAMTAERMGRLEELADQLDAEEDRHGFARLSSRFHDELYDAEAQPLLVELIRRLRGDVGRYWRMLGVAPQQLEDGAAHRELLRFAARRDVEGAQRCLDARFAEARDRLVASIERARPSSA